MERSLRVPISHSGSRPGSSMTDRIMTGRMSVHSKTSLAQLKAQRAGMMASDSALGRLRSPAATGGSGGCRPGGGSRPGTAALDFKALRASASQAAIRDEVERRAAGGEALRGKLRPGTGAAAAGAALSSSRGGGGGGGPLDAARRERLRESRRKLAEVLTYKLQAKYASGDQEKKQTVGKLVGTFVATSRGIREQDLLSLERTVAGALGEPAAAAAAAAGGGEGGGAGGGTASRPGTGRAGRPPVPQNATEILKAVGGLASYAPGDVPAALTSEWNLLDLYSAAQHESEREAQLRQAAEAKRAQRAALQAQVAAAGAARAAEVRALGAEGARQAALLEEWREEEARRERERVRLVLEEKAVRAAQLAEKRREREGRKAAALRREEAELEICRREMQEEERRRLEAVADERERQRRILVENEENERRREAQRREEEEENLRLMKEYAEMLDKQDRDRKEAFNKRIERYKFLGEMWESKGAGAQQREEELKLERKILSDAAAKEKADMERERKEKDDRLNQLLRNIEDNKKIIDQKNRLKEAERAEEGRFAAQYRREGERWAREGRERERRRRAGLADQRAHLEAQIAEVKARRTDDMDTKERQLNAALLHRLQRDQDTMRRVQAKVVEGTKGGVPHATMGNFGRIVPPGARNKNF